MLFFWGGAATAIPKFIGLTHNAKAATIEAVSGAMKSGLDLVHSRAIINRIAIPFYNGYPAVDGDDNFEDINEQVKAWLEIDAVDRDTASNNKDVVTFFTDKNSSDNQIYIFFSDDYYRKSVNLKCHVRYENPESANLQVTIEC